MRGIYERLGQLISLQGAKPVGSDCDPLNWSILDDMVAVIGLKSKAHQEAMDELEGNTRPTFKGPNINAMDM